ncbi:protein DnaJ [Seminavis robusta]|uniref:Protein DnaJ n=1 Tax=Seminavis robusta TaxID=568900 RepID=A0A9N8DUB2_9STRA|nr:protein DnaJ [Seminavis robusta]|eukprot:Sro281_g107220.1 protein DnaJ (341) ;mRNA; r:22168-23190
MSDRRHRLPKLTKEEAELFSQDLYDILGVSPGASRKDITTAYRSLAKKFHPDKIGAGSEDTFNHIKGAYEILKDPTLKARYDKQFQTRPRQSALQKAEQLFQQARDNLSKQQQDEVTRLAQQHQQEMDRLVKKHATETTRMKTEQEMMREMFRKQEQDRQRAQERQAEQQAEEARRKQQAEREQQAEARRKQAERAQQEARRKEQAEQARRKQAEERQRKAEEERARRAQAAAKRVWEEQEAQRKQAAEAAARAEKETADHIAKLRKQMAWEADNRKVAELLNEYLSAHRLELEEMKRFREKDLEVAQIFWEFAAKHKDGEEANAFPVGWIYVKESKSED